MNQTQSLCSTPDQLLEFLRGQLSSLEENELQSHLDVCESCRLRLEDTAADAEVWKEAERFLGTTPEYGSAEDSSFGHGSGASLQIQHVLGSLGPTDDPESLGRIGGYEVSGVIGAGGMGVVLKAREPALDRIVAIKVMALHLASNGSARKRFAREAKAAAAVIHPNVIAIHGVSNEDELPYLVMPYVSGASLQRRLDNDGQLPTIEVLRVGGQIAAGLAAAHDQGLVHRDIKPANIMLDNGVERVSITDFGLARAVDDASMTRTGVIAGTPQFMSPEQARGKSIDHRSDLFSLGSVLYAMCTGHAPFRAETSFGVLRRITDDEPKPIRELNPEIPEWLCVIISKLMSKHADDRYQSAAEVAELLEDCLAHVQQPTTTSLPESVARLAPKQNHRPPIGKFIAAAAFAFSLIFAGVLIVLELNKGTLTIESDVDDVPIRIMQGDTVVEKLTITTAGESIRIAAGIYSIELDNSFDNLVVDGGKVTLKRGQAEVVRIVHSIDQPKPSPVSSIEKLINLPADTEVHVIGCYYATNNQPVDVRVERTGKPQVVVLCAYNATSWNLNIDEDADVRGVILSGYFDQRFSHKAPPKDVPTVLQTYFPIWPGITQDEKKKRHEQCFYVWSPLVEDFGKMESLIREITGRQVTTFQGVYSAKSFVIDGRSGLEELRIATRWQKLSDESDRSSMLYRREKAELESMRDDDESGLSPGHLQRLNQRMDAYENELNRTGNRNGDTVSGETMSENSSPRSDTMNPGQQHDAFQVELVCKQDFKIRLVDMPSRKVGKFTVTAKKQTSERDRYECVFDTPKDVEFRLEIPDVQSPDGITRSTVRALLAIEFATDPAATKFLRKNRLPIHIDEFILAELKRGRGQELAIVLPQDGRGVHAISSAGGFPGPYVSPVKKAEQSQSDVLARVYIESLQPEAQVGRPANSKGTGIATGEPADRTVASDQPAETTIEQNLQGAWQAIRYTVGGSDKDTEPEKQRFIFKDGVLRNVFNHSVTIGEYDYRIDTTATPNRLTATARIGEFKGRNYEGIIHLRNGVLEICLPFVPETEPPGKFQSAEGSRHILAVLRKADDASALQGTWRVAKLTTNGKTLQNELATMQKFVFQGNLLKHLVNGKVAREFHFAVDSTTTPCTITQTATSGRFKDRGTKGIFRLRDKSLELCLPNVPDLKTPTSFQAERGSQLVLVTLANERDATGTENNGRNNQGAKSPHRTSE